MDKVTRLKELHSIKEFRGSKLGILRLNNLANPSKGIVVRFAGKEFLPISYDTYGHPIVSKQCFEYYKALKGLNEREGESLVPEVEYEPQYFVVRRDVYDSKEAFESIEMLPEEEQLNRLKEILIYRKKAHFTGKELKTYILYGKYALYEDGHVYICTFDEKEDNQKNVIRNVFEVMNQRVFCKMRTKFSRTNTASCLGQSSEMSKPIVQDLSEVSNFELLRDKKTEKLIELHIPGAKDKCAICGKKFKISDVKEFAITENAECAKVHSSCLYDCTIAENYLEASKIIDNVYSEIPPSEIIKEINEDGKEMVWYKYHTRDGDIGIRFKNKVREIKFFGNFKPFNLELLFKDVDVTKRRLFDAKIIHAWSKEAAIKYLMMVENENM